MKGKDARKAGGAASQKKASGRAKHAPAKRPTRSAKPPAAGRGGNTPSTEVRTRARKIASLVIAEHPDAHCMLDHKGAFELLVATILAAQCTDERVNMVSPTLFSRFPTPQAMARAEVGELEQIVRSTGFYRSKAKSIQGAAQALGERFPGGFPDRMEDLVSLPGVGRKTANVVLGVCYGQPAIIVDTHVRRVAQRLGIVTSDDPEEIERQLQALLPRAQWTSFSHALTFHGRRRCFARKPDHDGCVLRSLCDSRDL